MEDDSFDERDGANNSVDERDDFAASMEDQRDAKTKLLTSVCYHGFAPWLGSEFYGLKAPSVVGALTARTGATRRRRRRTKNLATGRGVVETALGKPQHDEDGKLSILVSTDHDDVETAATTAPSLLYPSTPEHWPVDFPRSSGEEMIPQSFRLPPALVLAAENMDSHRTSKKSEKSRRSRYRVENKFSDLVCEEAIVNLSSGDAAKVKQAVQWTCANTWPLSCSPNGCFVAQVALNVASKDDIKTLTKALHGRIRTAVLLPHANRVVQKCIEILDLESKQFVFDELKGHATDLARHRFGYRVIRKMIECCPEWQTLELIQELLPSSLQLCRHTCGNFVIQHILQYSIQQHQRAVIEIMISDLRRLARHRLASHVVRSALTHCTGEERELLIAAVKSDPADLADLTHHYCGSFVVREMRRELRT